MKAFLAPFEQAGVNAWVFDLRTNALVLSSEAAETLGHSSLNRPQTPTQWKDLVHPDDARDFEARVEQAVAGDKELKSTLRLLDGEGAWKPFEIRGRIVRRGARNTPILIGGLLAELRDGEFSPELFKAVIYAATEGIWVSGSDGMTSFVNQRMADMLETTPEKMVGSSPLNYIFPEDQALAGGIIARTMSGASERFEIDLRCASGEPLPALGGSAPLRDGSGQIVGAVAMFSDLTAWKETQAALVESERKSRIDHARLASAQKGAGAGAWEFDLYTQDIVLDEIGLEMHGLPAGTPMPISYDQWLSTMHGHVSGLQRLMTETVDDQFTFELSTGTGERWLLFLGRPIFDLNGAPMKVVGLILDISERKRAEAEMVRMRSELTQFARRSAMGTMASTIAHELNQPLAAAANYLSAANMMMARGDYEPVSSAVRAANETLIKAGEIIRKIRRGVGDINSQRQIADLRETILSALDLALLDAAQKGIHVSKRLRRNLAVNVDHIQIEQVIINLVRNAVHAVGDNPAPTISISTSVSKDRAKVHISDNGRGVEPGIRDRLFDSFSSSKEGGMGIGLSVSRTIIEAHEGRLWLHKTSSAGTTFIFELPLADQSHEAGSFTV